MPVRICSGYTYPITYVKANALWYIVPMARQRPAIALESLFRALADRTRLRLLNLIGNREICVCYLVEILGMSQPKISRHLAYLRRAGIVASRREGKWMHYRLSMPRDEAAADVLRETLKHLAISPEMQRDLAKLGSACCRPEKFELLQGAPQPQSIDPSAVTLP
jgi:ArsR family transcriptional regulator, arsenate/arsenite/antimonite-responsive transcriptional repressor